MTGIPDLERTDVDVRIGVTQTAREIAIELADDIDREALKAKVDAALTGAVDVLWLTDKKGRDVAIAAAKIAYVEVGNAEGDRRIGFGG
jgi:acetylornithine deacetylase/succinyl-diaminopimelate desuccinylase-like protein